MSCVGIEALFTEDNKTLDSNSHAQIAEDHQYRFSEACLNGDKQLALRELLIVKSVIATYASKQNQDEINRNNEYNFNKCFPNSYAEEVEEACR